MIDCPNCHHQEMVGSLFCSECGAKLVTADLPTTQNISAMGATGQSISARGVDTLSFQIRAKPASHHVTEPRAAPHDVALSLRLMESGKGIELTGQTEFTIGRVAEGQLILPDVDLSEFQAYGQGVSRLHATLKVNNQRVFITDLGSSNGTRINGQKIMPNIDFPLNHGDMIALGKFKMQILFHK